MSRLNREAECEAVEHLQSAWQMRRTIIDASSGTCRLSFDTPVVTTLAEINRAYRYGVEDGREDREGRRAPIEVLAFGGLK